MLNKTLKLLRYMDETRTTKWSQFYCRKGRKGEIVTGMVRKTRIDSGHLKYSTLTYYRNFWKKLGQKKQMM